MKIAHKGIEIINTRKGYNGAYKGYLDLGGPYNTIQDLIETNLGKSIPDGLRIALTEILGKHVTPKP